MTPEEAFERANATVNALQSSPGYASAISRITTLERENAKLREALEELASNSYATSEDRSVADDECKDDEWLANLCRQSADEIERLRDAYKRLHSQVGGYLHGAEWDHWHQYNEPRYAPAAALSPND